MPDFFGKTCVVRAENPEKCAKSWLKNPEKCVLYEHEECVIYALVHYLSFVDGKITISAYVSNKMNIVY